MSKERDSGPLIGSKRLTLTLTQQERELLQKASGPSESLPAYIKRMAILASLMKP